MGKNKFHIHGLKIKDLRNIDIVDVEFRDKKFVEINGKNAAGKSTFLDALFLTILGKKYMGKGFPVWRLIEQGKDKALMRVTLKSGERVVEIKRSITKKTDDEGNITSGGSLSITDTEGKELKQGHLDSLINEFTVDPVSFSREPAKKQIEIVKRLGGIDTTTIEEERETAFNDRTVVNREIKTLKAKLADEQDEVKAVNLEDLTKELDDIEVFNSDQQDLQTIIDEITADKAKKEAGISVIQGKIKDYEKYLKEEKDKLKAANGIMKVFNQELEEAKQPEELKSNEAVKLQISNAQDTNTKAAKYTQWLEDGKTLEKQQAKADNLTADMKKFDEDKKKMILNSNLPFKNVEFDDSVGLVIGGVPFNQKSDAEKIRISTRIGMEMAPGLRILCIKDGSLLDEKSYSTIKEMAEKHGYQVLVESVGERPGKDCIVMRQGRVVSQFEVTTTAKEEAARMEDEL